MVARRNENISEASRGDQETSVGVTTEPRVTDGSVSGGLKKAALSLSVSLSLERKRDSVCLREREREREREKKRALIT